MASSSTHNRNPEGKNQYDPVLTADSLLLREALEKYHRGLITDNRRIAELLLADHGIDMKPRTIKKRRQQLGLVGSRKTMKMLDPKEAEQLVLDQMDRDPARHQGPRTIRHKLAGRTGQHVARSFIAETMQAHDPAGFEKRDPISKRIHRGPKVPLGINERWSADGHDKLYGIGFPIWAIVDDATGKWLNIYVVPSNRVGRTILFLFLCTMEDVGGMPLQITTDCGSETTQLHGMAKALRESFHPDIDSTETPAHVYVRSVHNIAVERSWLRLRLEFGDSAVICFKRGEEDGIYLSHISEHAQLCQWLWPKLLRKLAKEFMESRNSYKSRRDDTKPGPSGMSRNEAYSLPHTWGGRQCLLEVNLDIVREIKDFVSNDEDMFRFPLVTAQFEQDADKKLAFHQKYLVPLYNECCQYTYYPVLERVFHLSVLYLDEHFRFILSSAMVVCTGCDQSFPRIDLRKCGKCQARKPGLSVPEIESLNSRPQCAGCGIMSNLLSGLCNPCIEFYQSAITIPREFMSNPRILELISRDSGLGLPASGRGIVTNLTNSILGTAVAHQENASESRIGVQVRKGSTKPDTGGLTRFKNLQKSGSSGATSILAERRTKKTDWVEQQSTTGPKFFITLWKCRGVEEKPKQVNQIHCSRVYDASIPMRTVLEDLLERLNSEFKSRLKVEYDLLWSQITLFAHESASVGVSIEYLRADEQLNSATAGSWLKEFASQRLGTKASLQAGILNIRFVVDDVLIPDVDFRSGGSSLFSQQPGNSARPSKALLSKRKRSDSAVVAPTSKRPDAGSSVRDIVQKNTIDFREASLPTGFIQPMAGSSSRLSLAQITPSHRSRTLKSAFRIPSIPASNWSREISLTNYQFTRSTAEYQPSGDVKISRSDVLELIAIAGDWVEGEELSKEKKHYKTGFIGRGSTKRGIYARYDNKEYVITQPLDDNMSFSAVREILTAELKLLAQCDGIKQKFDEFIRDGGIKGVPTFYFNVKDAFYGEIEPLSASGRRTMPHLGFLATPLLPCGRFDDPVRTRDRKKIMCLIDPQVHTPNPRNENTIYWDGGASKIAAWKEQHLPTARPNIPTDGLCSENWICSILELSGLEMQDSDDEADPIVGERSKIDYVLNK